MRKVELTPLEQLHLENTLKRGIKECNEGIKLCNAEGNVSGADYIRNVKRSPLVTKLYYVRQGYIYE